MTSNRNGLEAITIASPCQASWDAMQGDAKVRFCSLCQLNVYNLSGMTRAEADGLIQRTEGKICVRLYKRTDGTVITEDCPVGVRALRYVRRKVSVATASLAAFLGLGATAGCPDQAAQGRMVAPVGPGVTAPPLPDATATPGSAALVAPIKGPEPQVLMGKPCMSDKNDGPKPVAEKKPSPAEPETTR